MKGILDAVQGVFPFYPEVGTGAANDAVAVAAENLRPLEAAAKAIFVRASGLADYRKKTGFLFRAVDKTPPKA